MPKHFKTRNARKAVPGSLGVALDLADKAAARPEELQVPEDLVDLDGGFGSGNPAPKLRFGEVANFRDLFFFFAFFKGAELQSKGANMEIYLKVFPSFGCGFDSYFMRFGSLISFKSIKITMLKLSWRYVAVVRVKSGVSSTC